VVGEWQTVGAIPTGYSATPVRQITLFLPAIDLAGPLRVRALVWGAEATVIRGDDAGRDTQPRSQTLDVYAGSSAGRFDHIVAVDHLTDLQPLPDRQLRDRRSSGILTFSRISAAFFLADAVDVLDAISTRLLVGMFHPAGNTATDFSLLSPILAERQF